MKFLTFATPAAPRQPRLGALLGDTVIDLEAARAWALGAGRLPGSELPGSLFELILAGPGAWSSARDLVYSLEGLGARRVNGGAGRPVGLPLEELVLYPPLPRPMSLRDFYAFEQHVVTAFQNRGREVPAEWYRFPVFYFSNPNSIFGPGETIPTPASTQALDYELEVACVIGKPGRDIRPAQAEEYIFGYTILNDWTARDVQREEMKVGLGPAKGKDFATTIGPWVTTPDELAEQHAGRPGVYDLRMSARLNGIERSCGNWKDLHYSFGEMIARASADAWLMPGDLIGSGTVGTGCLLELTRGAGPWLSPGDIVELEVERLGVLRNEVGKKVEREA